jgi:hypothetical protein
VWIKDTNYAIIIENKIKSRKQKRQEREYLAFLHEEAFQGLRRAFLYAVPQEWLASWEKSDFMQFVREREASDEVLRGVIAWDEELAGFLSDRVGVPQWFRDKLPNRVSEGKFLDPGQTFWQAWGIDLDTKHRLR